MEQNQTTQATVVSQGLHANIITPYEIHESDKLRRSVARMLTLIILLAATAGVFVLHSHASR